MSQFDLGRGSWVRTSQPELKLEMEWASRETPWVVDVGGCCGESLTPRAPPLGEAVGINYSPGLGEPLKDKQSECNKCFADLKGIRIRVSGQKIHKTKKMVNLEIHHKLPKTVRAALGIQRARCTSFPMITKDHCLSSSLPTWNGCEA